MYSKCHEMGEQGMVKLKKCKNITNKNCFIAEKSKFRGTNVILNKFQTAHSKIVVMEKSPYGPEKRNSIIEFWTDEGERGKGHATSLLNQVMKAYPKKLGGQVSSAKAPRILWGKGWHPYDKKLKTLDDTENERKKKSSVYMIKG